MVVVTKLFLPWLTMQCCTRVRGNLPRREKKISLDITSTALTRPIYFTQSGLCFACHDSVQPVQAKGRK
jgi:hypothetical protein